MTQEIWDSTAKKDNCIAMTFHQLQGTNFRYIGNHAWEKLENDAWIKDTNKTSLRTALLSASAQVTCRAMAWNDMKTPDAIMNRDRLMNIATRLKSKTGQDAIMREAREYFVQDN